MSEQASPPLRTWRPMALWSAAILLALGLTWFVGAVVVPVWQVHRVLSDATADIPEALGGQEAAARKLSIYLHLHPRLASEQQEAVSALALCGPAAVPELARQLQHNDKVFRTEAAKSLAEIGDVRAFEPLVRALTDPEWEVRSHAIQALQSLRDPRSVGPLIGALHDQILNVRVLAIRALGELGGAAVEPLLAALKDRSICREVIKALGLTGDPRAFDPLLRMLDDENPEVRGMAGAMLGRFKDPRAIDPLMKLLRDKHDDASMGAIDGLGGIGEPAVAPLVAVLDDEEVRNVAILALGSTHSPKAIAPLVGALSDPKPINRRAAATALYSMGPLAVETLPALEKLLLDEDERVRKTASQAIEEIRAAAAKALEKIEETPK